VVVLERDDERDGGVVEGVADESTARPFPFSSRLNPVVLAFESSPSKKDDGLPF